MDHNFVDRHKYGIDILRIVLCFGVVISHFWSPTAGNNVEQVIGELRQMAAPTFFMLSFFLTSKRIIKADKEYLTVRLKRLKAPFYFWGFVAWLFLLTNNFRIEMKEELIISLFWQLTTGHSGSLNPPLWYLMVLCLITWITTQFFRLGKRNGYIILFVITVFAMVCQYCGLNYWLFNNLPYELKYPFGRCLEMVPYATTGLLISSIKIDEISGIKRTLYACLCAIGLFAILLLTLIMEDPATKYGFGYSGFYKLIGSSLLIIAFSMIKISGERCKKIIRLLSSHTLGVYCMHYILGINFQQIGYGFKSCLIIYILCYCVAEILGKIPYFKRVVD